MKQLYSFNLFFILKLRNFFLFSLSFETTYWISICINNNLAQRYISLGHSFYANMEQIHILPGFSQLLVQYTKMSLPWGGVCVCFSKSMRKGHFRNVWVGGGGRWSQCCAQSCTREDTQGTGNGPGITHYSESDLLSSLPLSARAGTPLGLQINVDAGCQKFMLRSLAGVLFTIPKLGCKGSGLCSGQNLVFLVGAGRLLRTTCTRLFGLPGRLPGHLYPICTPRACPFSHQRFLWCIGGSNSLGRSWPSHSHMGQESAMV